PSVSAISHRSGAAIAPCQRRVTAQRIIDLAVEAVSRAPPIFFLHAGRMGTSATPAYFASAR
ncbi:MAG TPA: hypothetical protein VKG24_05590, partial [Pseudolabrys sp.]|nr:hypothetical protein [Pseudolabrys sp.]